MNNLSDRGTLRGTLQRNSGNYNDLINKPAINGHTLIGNQSGHALGLANLSDIVEVEANPIGAASGDLNKLRVDDIIYNIPDVIVYGEASGAIASFDDGGDNKPLKQLKVAINPVQSGSGEPSPQNVRPIVGKNAINVLNLDLPNGNYMASDRQISFAWKDGDTEYDMPFNVMANETVKDSSDNDVDVLTLESEYVLPFDIVYDAPEAIYASANDLSAGDYYFKIANDSWGGNNGKYVCFTLADTLTAGKQIRKKSGAYNAAIENCALEIYTDGTDTAGTALSFTVETTEPSTGTSLGQTDGSGDLNHWHCVVLGYNRYKYSAVRQYLNADAVKNTWWVQQHKWDVMPAYATTKDGFLYGLSADVKARLKTTKIATARNTVFNSGDTPIGDMDITYDKVFLIGLEQSYISPQVKGEGETWEYYKLLNGTSTPYQRSSTYADLIKYDVAAKRTARDRWLRSCRRGYAYGEWYVNSSGGVYNNNASIAYRVDPCLRIGVNKKDTVNLGNTCYGGKLDVTSGVLTVTHANIASYNGESINEPWISSEDAYESGATPTTGAQVVYPLTTPLTVQLTPTQIKTLLGNNNIWSDTGEIEECVYQRDINIALNKALNQ